MYKAIISTIIILCSIKIIEANEIIGITNNKILLNKQYSSYLKLQKLLNNTNQESGDFNSFITIMSRIAIARKSNIINNEDALDNEIKKIEERQNMQEGSIKQNLVNNNISYDTYKNIIQYQILTSQIQQSLLQNNINVTEDQIDNFIINRNKEMKIEVRYYKFIANKNEYKKLQTLRSNYNKTSNKLHNIKKTYHSSYLSELTPVEQSIISNARLKQPTLIIQKNDQYQFFIILKRKIINTKPEERKLISQNIAISKAQRELNQILNNWDNNSNISILTNQFIK